jgi:hypothetical protein
MKKKKTKKLSKKEQARKDYEENQKRHPAPELSEEEQQAQSLKQMKIKLATSEYAPIVIEIIRDCARKVPLIGKDQFETTVNAITMDVTSTLMRDVVEYFDNIKKGLLHQVK